MLSAMKARQDEPAPPPVTLSSPPDASLSHDSSPLFSSPDRRRPSRSTTALEAPGSESGSFVHTAPQGLARKPSPRLLRASTNTPFEKEREKSRGDQVDGSSASIDPLSQHIFVRTNTDHTIRLRTHSNRAESPSIADSLGRTISGPKPSAPAGDASKDKKKGVSFLSRLSMRGSKKRHTGDFDSDSELGSETRADPTDAQLFTQAIGAGGGFIPVHKEPPRYIRTRAHNKRLREFNRMFLAQELVGTRPLKATDQDGGAGERKAKAVPPPAAPAAPPQATAGGRGATRSGGAIWAAEFSTDGKYLAAAGRDGVVRVWAVISTPEERRAHEEDERACGNNDGARLSAPVFRQRPAREFEGHTGEVLDLSWSKNNFLLSSSMDKTVRLWHMSRDACLCTFRHKDFVTRLAFHPRDDRFFLAGSLDTMLRLWSIPDKAVAYSAQLPDLVTAVAFSPDGTTAIAGLLNGLCLFFDTDGLKLQTQIHVRSSRGKNAKGSKITGIQAMAVPSPAAPPAAGSTRAAGLPPGRASSSAPSGAGSVKVLITSNDSRIRIYNLRDKTLEVKLKGHHNSHSQIAATFSDDGKYIVCGSEDRKAFIWNAGADYAENKDARPYEYFDGGGEIVTNAIFAPTKSRMLLGGGGDPIYDLCNPPPVMLMSLEEAASASASQTGMSDGGTAGAAPELNGRVYAKRPEESPAYIARSTHYDGNIIVTTDDTGVIKVFRQDCALMKRKYESWETGSTFSRKLAGSGYVGGSIGRSTSVLSKTTASSVSRRNSVSQGLAGAVASPQLGPSNISSDRIDSWRQGIEAGSCTRADSITSRGTPARSERSPSPGRTARTLPGGSGAQLASVAKTTAHPVSPPPTRELGHTTSPARSATGSGAAGREGSPRIQIVVDEHGKDKDEPAVPPTPSFSFQHAAQGVQDAPRTEAADAGGYSFWNLSRWRNLGIIRINEPANEPGPSESRLGNPAASLARHPTTDAAAGGDRSADNLDRANRRRTLPPSSLSQVVSHDSEHDPPTPSLPASEDADQHASCLAPSPYLRSQSSVVGRPSSEIGREAREGRRK